MNVFHLTLAGLMLVTGSINTLSVKWADTMVSKGRDGKIRGFNHPFLQACCMFLGEMMCMVAFFITRYYRRKRQTSDQETESDPFTRKRTWNPLVFFPPAMCDMTATSVTYIGLTMTYASSFQMLRGAVIIFTGILSKLALKRKLGWYRWLGILFVIGGLTTVGVCDMLYQGDNHHKNDTVVLPQNHSVLESVSLYEYRLQTDPDKDNSRILLGDILIICAQVIVATQMVYEEKFVSRYNVPALQAVGWEGFFGFATLSLLLIPFYFIPVGPEFGNNPRHVLEDVYDGFVQLYNNPWLLSAFIGTAISISFFNFAGISVTKEMSATTRMVLDSVRTLIIWAVSLQIGWQDFHALQLLGFSILVVGMCVYNNLIFVPSIRYIGRKFGWLNEESESLITDAEEESSQTSEEPEVSIYETQ